MQQFGDVSRTRTIYSTETHTSHFILNTFWNGKPVQFFQEKCWVVVTGCQENKSCSKVLNFLERLDDRIRCIHEKTVAVAKPRKDIGSNKSLGCLFSEKPADWTNAFKLEISSFMWGLCLSTSVCVSCACLSIIIAGMRAAPYMVIITEWNILQPVQVTAPLMVFVHTLLQTASPSPVIQSVYVMYLHCSRGQ